jgi:hypothetical protein
VAVAPANSRTKALKAARAASRALLESYDDQERTVETQIAALEDRIGTARAPDADELQQFDAFEDELTKLNESRRATIFVDFATLPSAAEVTEMLAQMKAVRSGLVAEKTKLAGMAERVQRIDQLTQNADAVVATLTRLAALLV